MALWTGTTINTNEMANLINQWVDVKALSIVSRKNGFLYAILGKQEVAKEPVSVGFQRHTKTSGQNVQFNLRGRLKTIGTVADGTAETTVWATIGTVIASDTFGGVTLPLVHFVDAEYFPGSELDRYAGDELRTRDWVEQKLEYLIDSWEDTVGTAFNATGATVPSRTQICPWRHQISDGTQTGETLYQTYGLDRADANNSDFRGIVITSTGDLTLQKIRTLQNTIKTRGGNPTLGVAETTLYGKIQSLVESYTTVNYKQDWSRFGGEYVNFAGIDWILEQRMGTQLIGLIDPNFWHIWSNFKNFTRGGIVLDPSRKDTMVLNWKVWFGIYTQGPNRNGLLTGVTS